MAGLLQRPQPQATPSPAAPMPAGAPEQEGAGSFTPEEAAQLKQLLDDNPVLLKLIKMIKGEEPAPEAEGPEGEMAEEIGEGEELPEGITPEMRDASTVKGGYYIPEKELMAKGTDSLRGFVPKKPVK